MDATVNRSITITLSEDEAHNLYTVLDSPHFSGASTDIRNFIEDLLTIINTEGFNPQVPF